MCLSKICKVMCGILVMVVFLTACSGSDMSENQEAEEENIENIQESPKDGSKYPTIDVDKEVEPIVSEQVDSTRKGIEMPNTLYPSQVVQGDDGDCYYLRIIEEGDEKRIIFYKNNEKKVCETKIPKELRKKKYHIGKFVKYGEYFFADLFSTEESEDILATIAVDGGEWNVLNREMEIVDKVIFYGNNIYCSEAGYVFVYDLSGKKIREMEIEATTWKRIAKVQCIVDNKIYYYYTDREDVGETKIKRCDLDGSNKEALFKYKRETADLNKGMLQIDDNYIYIIASLGGERSFSRIPLYGGKIEGISKTLNFKLSEDSIYYIGGEKDYIYQVDKELKTNPKAVVKITASDFWYVNGYLMVEKSNTEEEEILGAVEEYDERMRDYYCMDYFWTTTSGDIVKKIPGSGIKQEDLDLYEIVKDYD